MADQPAQFEATSHANALQLVAGQYTPQQKILQRNARESVTTYASRDVLYGIGQVTLAPCS
jgi:hypothetical protein